MKLFGFSITACSCDNFDRSVEFGGKKTRCALRKTAVDKFRLSPVLG